MTKPSMTIASFSIYVRNGFPVGVNMAEESKQIYGGQAVIEGVMFGGREYTVTAVRRKDKSIEFYRLPRVRNKALSLLKKIPFLRGIAAIVDASANGAKHLNFASERFDVHPEEDEQLANKKEEQSKLTMVSENTQQLAFYRSYSVK